MHSELCISNWENGMKQDNIIVDKSKAFAVRIVKMCRYLQEERREFVLSKQVLRSGTSIGANVKEAIRGQSTADFIAKMNIALKEASETEYWLELLTDTDYLSHSMSDSILSDCVELIKLLTAIIKTAKKGDA